MTRDDDNRAGGGLFFALGATLLVIACCALGPLLAVGGVIAGIGALLRNPWAIAAGTALLILAGLTSFTARLRRKRHR
jgi:membrane protein implicated in regulation of membrane protease activity